MYLMHSFPDSTSCSAPRLLNFQSHAATFAVGVLCQSVPRLEISFRHGTLLPTLAATHGATHATHPATIARKAPLYIPITGLVMADLLINDKILRSGGVGIKTLNPSTTTTTHAHARLQTCKKKKKKEEIKSKAQTAQHSENKHARPLPHPNEPKESNTSRPPASPQSSSLHPAPRT